MTPDNVSPNAQIMLNRLKRLVRGKPKAEKGDNLPEIPWVPPENNQWRVPVLDLRPVTHQMLSTTKNEECARNALSSDQEPRTGHGLSGSATRGFRKVAQRCRPVVHECFRQSGGLWDTAPG